MGDIPYFILNDGKKWPAIGLGTYKLNGSEGVEAMKAAIRNGYRHLDSAFNYENEGALGKAIKQCKIARDELQIVSKLPGRHHRYDEALRTIEESLYRADLDYYDLYLIHWPNPIQNQYVEAWQALIEARKRGWLKSIGVCNFLPEHLDRLIKETKVTPSVNQIELHPYFPQDEQRKADKERGILTQGWSPLSRGNSLMQEPILTSIAKRLGKSVPQVVLRWHVELGVQPLPKSSDPERQLENLLIFDFELTAEDRAKIATLARKDGRINDQDPARYEEF